MRWEWEGFTLFTWDEGWTCTDLHGVLESTTTGLTMFQIGKPPHKAWSQIKEFSSQFMAEEPAWGRRGPVPRPLWTTLTSSSKGGKRRQERPQEARQQRVVLDSHFNCSITATFLFSLVSSHQPMMLWTCWQHLQPVAEVKTRGPEMKLSFYDEMDAECGVPQKATNCEVTLQAFVVGSAFHLNRFRTPHRCSSTLADLLCQRAFF